MRLSAFVVLATLLLGSTGFAQNVKYDFDKRTDFSKFKTYAWVSGTNLEDQLNHTRIVNAVDTQLRAKGLSKVEMSANPDAFVAYHATFDKNRRITALFTSWGPYPVASGTASGVATEIVVGTVAVDVIDANTKAVVWRGIATKEVDVNASPEKRERNINRAAEKVFKNYPPKT